MKDLRPEGLSYRGKWLGKIARFAKGRDGSWCRGRMATPGQVAVACECGMEERAEIVMERARVPKRYEHCDFESFATDLDGREDVDHAA